MRPNKRARSGATAPPPALVFVVEDRPGRAAELRTALESLGHTTWLIEDIDTVAPYGRAHGAEVALVSAGFAKVCGGAVGRILTCLLPSIEVVLYVSHDSDQGGGGAVSPRLGFPLIELKCLRRNLRLVVERLATAARAGRAARHLVSSLELEPEVPPDSDHEHLYLDGLEQDLGAGAIRLALRLRGTVRGAADFLGLARSTLRTRMEKLDIPVPACPNGPAAQRASGEEPEASRPGLASRRSR